MLENVKSQYLVKLLFTFLLHKRKLRIVRYNKQLQKKLDINLIFYKNMTNKYIIYEGKGIGKEYDLEGKLLFKGQYYNGERNGNGEEYYYSDIEYKGEFKDGKRNGYGKENRTYYTFEGEFKNGKYWNGIYKERDYDFDEKRYFTILEAEYKDGKIWNASGYINIKNGSGYVTIFNKSKKKLFEGIYLNGEKNGKGCEYHENGELKFEGEYFNDKKWNGKGYDIKGNIAYELKNGNGCIKEYFESGKLKCKYEYLNGEKNGKEYKYNEDGDIECEKQYLNGKLNGLFKMNNLCSGVEYEYLNDYKNGKGKIFYKDDKYLFEGEYAQGMKIRGKEYINGKLAYEGEYIYDNYEDIKYNGKGYDENGCLIYELIHGNGKVKEYRYDGTLSFEGEYKNGRKNGIGKLYDLEGNLRYEGEFIEGVRKDYIKKLKNN